MLITAVVLHGKMVKVIIPYWIQVLGVELIQVSSQSAHRWHSHELCGRLQLLSARPAVTFPAREHHHPLKGKGGHALRRRQGAHLPHIGLWARRWIDHWVCDTWPVQRQTYGYLRNPSLMDYYSFNQPRRDGWLSWPCWLTDSGRFTHKVVTRPAVSLAQDRESSPARTGGLTTMLHHRPLAGTKLYCLVTELCVWANNLPRIRPLSVTVPLWSGSSYRAFVYIGNDGFCYAADCKRYNHKDKWRFLSVSK